MSGDSIRKSIRDYENMRESERTYTAEEVRLERAALLREAVTLTSAFMCRSDVWKPQELYDALLAISTDQSALDRHDAELLADFVQRTFPPTPGGYVSATEAKAQTAAMLEKAADHLNRMKQLGRNPNEAWRQVTAICCESIKSFIPADHAAALAERVRQAVREEAEWIDNQIAGTQGLTKYDDEALNRVREHIAAHRAAAGAPVPDWGRSKSQDKRLKAQGAPGAPEKMKP